MSSQLVGPEHLPLTVAFPGIGLSQTHCDSDKVYCMSVLVSNSKTYFSSLITGDKLTKLISAKNYIFPSFINLIIGQWTAEVNQATVTQRTLTINMNIIDMPHV